MKATLTKILLAKASALRVAKECSYQVFDSAWTGPREDIEHGASTVLQTVFLERRITKVGAERIFKNRAVADAVMNQLRALDVLKVEGQKRGAKWIFTDSWVHADHEVTGA